MYVDTAAAAPSRATPALPLMGVGSVHPDTAQAPGKLRMPTDADYSRECDRRAALTLACNTDPAARLRELQACELSVEHWIRNWCWLYEPRGTMKTIPWMPWPVQCDLITWLRNLKNRAVTTRQPLRGFVVKSRGMGATWLTLTDALHDWLFVPGFSCGFGSRKLDLVDQLGNMDSMFEKVRWQLERLPGWMLPEGYNERRDAAWCRIANPQTGASLVGEAGDDIGRGGRSTQYVIDESAFLPHPDLIEKSLSDNTDCRIDVSTVNRPVGPFYRGVRGGKHPPFYMKWDQHPGRDEKWKEAQIASIGPIMFASEYGMDFSAAVEGICIPARFVAACIEAPLLDPGGTPYVPRGPKVAGFDIGETSNTLLVRQGAKVLTVHQWPEDLDDALWTAVIHCEQYGVDVLLYDAAGDGVRVADVLQKGASAGRRVAFQVVPVNVGVSAPDVEMPDGRRAYEVYANLRAFLWHGVMRAAIERTWEWKVKDSPHFASDCLCLPEDPQLEMELSIPLKGATAGGKLLIESKLAMKERNVESPHRADALSLSFAPVPDVLVHPGERQHLIEEPPDA